MKIVYRCEFCNAEFTNQKECLEHEESHLSGMEKIKHFLMQYKNVDLCDYCDRSYYVYGCEIDCEFKDCRYANNYKDFVPVEPLHDKRSRGGV